MTANPREGGYGWNNVVSIWDVESGTHLLSREYYATGLPAWMASVLFVDSIVC
jgi:hypothetical protein